jgi:hypothetical protein
MGVMRWTIQISLRMKITGESLGLVKGQEGHQRWNRAKDV